MINFLTELTNSFICSGNILSNYSEVDLLDQLESTTQVLDSTESPQIQFIKF